MGKRCTSCGAELPVGVGFCQKCGAMVSMDTGNHFSASGSGAERVASVRESVSERSADSEYRGRKRRFNFVAFFFPITWAYAKRLWTQAIVGTAVVLILCMVGNHYGELYTEVNRGLEAEQNEAGKIVDEWNESTTGERLWSVFVHDRGVQEVDDEYQSAMDAAEEKYSARLADLNGRMSGAYILMLIFHLIFRIYLGVNGNEMVSARARA